MDQLSGSTFFKEIEEKFSEERADGDYNIGCLRLYGGVTREVKIAADEWIRAQGKLDAICLTSVAIDERDSFFVITKPGAEFIKEIIKPPDDEDQMYVGVYSFLRTIEGLRLAQEISEKRSNS